MEGSRIIVAADFPSLEEAVSLARRIGPQVFCFKVGNQLAATCGSRQAVAAIADAGCRVFRDGKWIDIPNTVAGTAAAEMQAGLVMFNMMCQGGVKMLAAGREAAAKEMGDLGFPPPIALGVTVLTSLDFDDLKAQGLFPNVPDNADAASKDRMVKDEVVRLALLAKQAGLGGVIASAQEAPVIRQACGPKFLIVTPGIRGKNDKPDDQKRTMTAAEAIAAGVDYLIIGRPITKAADPAEAVRQFNEEIAEALAKKDGTCPPCGGGPCQSCE